MHGRSAPRASGRLALRFSTTSMIDPIDELERVQTQLGPEIEAAMDEYARCVAGAMIGSARDSSVEKACIEKLADRFALLAMAADIMGRARALKEAAA